MNMRRISSENDGRALPRFADNLPGKYLRERTQGGADPAILSNEAFIHPSYRRVKEVKVAEKRILAGDSPLPDR